jgi:prepilin-type N-terminal cleavage/methylation domain-containing protein
VTTRHICPDHRRGFTLVEAVVCTVIVGIILVAAIATLGASKRVQKGGGDRATAQLLAADLLAEIASKAYAEPDMAGGFGIDPGEQPSVRATFDDVDDYDGYTESPPKDAAGNAIAGYEHWTRSVRVERIIATAPEQAATIETGAKRITVTVTCNDVVLATRGVIRTGGADAGRAGSATATTR